MYLRKYYLSGKQQSRYGRRGGGQQVYSYNSKGNKMASFQEVLHSAINNSKSKESHAFPKAQRFADNTAPPCYRAHYDLSPLMMSSRIKRRDRTTSQSARTVSYETLSPGPAAYSPPAFPLGSHVRKAGSTFDQAQRLQRGGREVPGPGAYSPQHRDKRVQFSMAGRLQRPLALSSVGPGKYYAEKYNTIDGGAKYYSKYSHPRSFRMSKEERFHETSKTVTPGPSQYGSLAARERKSFVFGRSERPPLVDTKWMTPGPGQYHEFSEFAERRRQMESNLSRMERLVKEK